jgi:hypothetical protein
MVYLGPTLNNQGHRMWNPATCRVIELRNVRFLKEEDNASNITLPDFSIVELEGKRDEDIPMPNLVENDEKDNDSIDIVQFLPIHPLQLQPMK